jgi:transposase InsO family protein
VLGSPGCLLWGNIKGVGHIYQQAFIDTYTKAALCKLCGRKNALVAADMPNGAVLPFFDSHELPLLRILTGRGSECCGNREHHEYALCLEVENTGHTKTKAKPPQANGTCEGFNKTCKDGFYPAAFRKKAYRSIKELQAGLDEWVRQYNYERAHSGKYCYGRTPVQTFTGSVPLAKEKLFGYDASGGQPA